LGIASGSTHIGAPGNFEDTVYVPTQGPFGVIKVSKNSFSNPTFYPAESGKNRFSWRDVNPLNGRLYTSEFDFWNNEPGALLAYDRTTLERSPEDDIQLGEADIHFDRIQGGVFTRHGRVILSRCSPNGLFCFSAITGASLGCMYVGDYGSSYSKVEGVSCTGPYSRA
jgi:hypothetical protein